MQNRVRARSSWSGHPQGASWSRLGRLAASVAAALFLPGLAAADPCEVPDSGGTAVLPPEGCDYLGRSDVYRIIEGLPPGTTIELEPIHKDFICPEQQFACSAVIPPGLCEAPGGGLGGNVSCSNSTLELQVTGTGLLTGFSRILSIQTFIESHSGPRNPGDPEQVFPTELIQLDGQLFGDPDFDQLVIRAGSAFGLPSPGETTLSEKPAGDWVVDSFFDVTYQIDFVGAPGGVLDGMSGSTQGSLGIGSNLNPCDVTDNGTGTATLPPAGCQYISNVEEYEILDGLPPGTTISLDAVHRNFACGNQLGICSVALDPGVCEAPGGSLGGNVECFLSEYQLEIVGTGTLTGFQRNMSMPMNVEVHTAPRSPGSPAQDFGSRLFRLQGEIFGDPDFCTFQIRGGDQLGLPSPGHKTLTDNGDGTFEVDSFFDVSYEIDFQGCPGSMLEGFGGTTNGTIRMQTGDPVTSSAVPGVTGSGIWLLGGLLVLTSLVTYRRFAWQP